MMKAMLGRILVIALVLAALALYGCETKSVVSDKVADATAPADQKTGAADTAGAAGGGQVITDDKVSSKDIASAGGAGGEMKGMAEGPKFNDIYFDFDSHALSKPSQTTLIELATWLINNNAIALLEGHCDDRGTSEYNLALGDRRAASAKNFLLANGIDPRKIETVSYGEERPQCKQQTEDCWAKNRRVHFIVEVLK